MTADDAKTPPNRIAALVEERFAGSFQKLADRIEERTGYRTTRQTLWKLAVGRLRLTQDWMVRIAAGLEVTPAELLRPEQRGLAESEGRFLQGNELSELERDQARRLYPEGAAATMIMQGRALVLAGYLPGDRLLIDQKRTPQAGDAVVLQAYDAAGEAQTHFRVYRPPQLLPASAELVYRFFDERVDEISILGVIVGSYRSRRFDVQAA